MNNKVFSSIGWILLVLVGISWIAFGYSSWYLLLLPLSRLSFAVSDGSIKKLGKLSLPHWLHLLVTLAITVAVAFGLIVLANFLITDVLHITGWIKTVFQVIAIILALYPAKFVYDSVTQKVFDDAKTEEP